MLPPLSTFQKASQAQMNKGVSIALALFLWGKGAPLCRSTGTLVAAIIATVLAVIHPAAIPAIIPANVPAACIPAIIPAIIPANLPAAWVSIRPVTRVRVGPVILRLVRLIVGAHITVIGPISITGHARGAVISARIIAVRATPVARIRFI